MLVDSRISLRLPPIQSKNHAVFQQKHKTQNWVWPQNQDFFKVRTSPSPPPSLWKIPEICTLFFSEVCVHAGLKIWCKLKFFSGTGAELTFRTSWWARSVTVSLLLNKTEDESCVDADTLHVPIFYTLCIWILTICIRIITEDHLTRHHVKTFPLTNYRKNLKKIGTHENNAVISFKSENAVIILKFK